MSQAICRQGRIKWYIMSPRVSPGRLGIHRAIYPRRADPWTTRGNWGVVRRPQLPPGAKKSRHFVRPVYQRLRLCIWLSPERECRVSTIQFLTRSRRSWAYYWVWFPLMSRSRDTVIPTIPRIAAITVQNCGQLWKACLALSKHLVYTFGGETFVIPTWNQLWLNFK